MATIVEAPISDPLVLTTAIVLNTRSAFRLRHELHTFMNYLRSTQAIRLEIRYQMPGLRTERGKKDCNFRRRGTSGWCASIDAPGDNRVA